MLHYSLTTNCILLCCCYLPSRINKKGVKQNSQDYMLIRTNSIPVSYKLGARFLVWVDRKAFAKTIVTNGCYIFFCQWWLCLLYIRLIRTMSLVLFHYVVLVVCLYHDVNEIYADLYDFSKIQLMQPKCWIAVIGIVMFLMLNSSIKCLLFFSSVRVALVVLLSVCVTS